MPQAYRGVQPPAADFMTDPANLRAGQALYRRHCATCHGETGRGDGPAGLALQLKPADLSDPTGVSQEPLDYWFWRLSEGGTVEPFHSQGSVMPAWKYHLSEVERWQVIAFARTLSASAAGEWAPAASPWRSLPQLGRPDLDLVDGACFSHTSTTVVG